MLRFTLIAGGIALMGSSLTAASPPIVVSRETTHLTTSDGSLPDYYQELVSRARNGVTAEENAAVIMLGAMWPPELQPAFQQHYCAELGVGVESIRQTHFEDLDGDQITAKMCQWLISRYVSAHPDEKNDVQTLDQDDRDYWLNSPNLTAFLVRSDAQYAPWTSQQIPPLAGWLQENDKALDVFVAAAQKNRFYSPPQAFLDRKPGGLTSALGFLEGGQQWRTVARSLTLRAMWHLGAGRHSQAWIDLRATHHLARRISRQGMLIDRVIGIAVDGVANVATRSLLDAPTLNIDDAQQILAELQQIKDFERLGGCFDQFERLMVLDLVTRLATGKVKPEHFFWIVEEDCVKLLLDSDLDWNDVLRMTNKWLDRVSEVANVAKFEERNRQFRALGQELNRITDRAGDREELSRLDKPERQVWIAAKVMSFFLEAFRAGVDAVERNRTAFALTKTAAQLAVTRAKTGYYPDDLSGVPTFDVYSSGPFLYRRTKGGYLLYSVFENQRDDGGTSIGGSIVKGVRVSEETDVQGETDLVILQPAPKFEITDLKKRPPSAPFPFDIR